MNNRTFIGPNLNTNGGKKIILDRPQNEMKVKIATICKGQIAGFNDVIAKRPYTTSLRCVSAKGSAFVIKAQDFLYYMQRDHKTWKLVLETAKLKDQDLKSQVK